MLLSYARSVLTLYFYNNSIWHFRSITKKKKATTETQATET